MQLIFSLLTKYHKSSSLSLSLSILKPSGSAWRWYKAFFNKNFIRSLVKLKIPLAGRDSSFLPSAVASKQEEKNNGVVQRSSQTEIYACLPRLIDEQPAPRQIIKQKSEQEAVSASRVSTVFLRSRARFSFHQTRPSLSFLLTPVYLICTYIRSSACNYTDLYRSEPSLIAIINLLKASFLIK